MIRKLNIVRFWIVAFYTIIRETLKGNEWNMVYVDIHFGDNEDGIPIRKQLIARRMGEGFTVYWQDLDQMDT